MAFASTSAEPSGTLDSRLRRWSASGVRSSSLVWQGLCPGLGGEVTWTLCNSPGTDEEKERRLVSKADRLLGHAARGVDRSRLLWTPLGADSQDAVGRDMSGAIQHG